MAIHLTPTELGREAGMHRREVISKCMEMGVPIFQGRIDKTLFLSTLKQAKSTQAAAAGVASARSLAGLPLRIGLHTRHYEGEPMEAVTAGVAGAGGVGTGSKTIADLLPLAVEKYGDAPAQRHKVGDAWVDVSYAELGRRCARSRSGSWTSASSPATRSRSSRTPARSGPAPASGSSPPAAPSSRSTRPTPPRSASTCWPTRTRGRCSSRTATSWRRSARSASDCPELRHVIVMDPGDAELDDELTLDALRERGRRPRRGRVAPALRGRDARRRLPLHLHVGHHRPAEGLPALARQLPRDHRRRDQGQRARGRRQRLPLPPARARVRDPDPVHRSSSWARRSPTGRGDAKQIIPDLTEVKPSFFPSVPRMFEKIYTLATNAAPDREQLDQAVELGVKVRMAQEAGEAGARGARDRLRAGRGGALQERARAVRRPDPRVRDRRRADRPRDPALLLRLRRARDGGLRHDRDLHQRHGQPPDRRRLPLRLGGPARRTAWR